MILKYNAVKLYTKIKHNLFFQFFIINKVFLIYNTFKYYLNKISLIHIFIYILIITI